MTEVFVFKSHVQVLHTDRDLLQKLILNALFMLLCLFCTTLRRGFKLVGKDVKRIGRVVGLVTIGLGVSTDLKAALLETKQQI